MRITTNGGQRTNKAGESMRIENDGLGNIEVPEGAYWGAHTQRALKNFPITREKFDEEFIRAYGYVKKATASLNGKLGFLTEEKCEAICKACDELIAGQLSDWIVVDPLSGGAGTSINMNINEVIANRATELLGGKKGEYLVHPLDDVNMHQSTNDTFPTAGKMAVIVLLKELVVAVEKLQEALQIKEKEFWSIMKPGRTQLMDAVPISLGQEFGAMAEAISRDRWRLYKVEERVRMVNLGGTAIGTGVAADRKYVLSIVNELRNISGIRIAKAENLIDATQNMDVFAEIHGLLKALATNLLKISNDIRLLGSGPNSAIGELKLPQVQAGSSIMPGKVNPVVPEYVIQMSMSVMAHDVAVNFAVSSGNLELNAFVPLIIHYTLKSLRFLTNAAMSLKEYIVKLQANNEKSRENLLKSEAVFTPMITAYGYERVQRWIKKSREEGKDIWEIAAEETGLKIDELKQKLLGKKSMGLGQSEKG